MSGAYVRERSSNSQRALVAAARARRAVQPRHGFDVVVQDVRPRVEHRAQRRFVSLEIGNQHFDAAAGIARARLRDRSREVRRAAVRQVVAIDRGDDDVARAPWRGWRCATFAGSCWSGGFGAPWIDVAVAARPRAGVAEDHERRRAVVPALADVRAVGFLADGVQAERPHQPLEAVVVLRPRRAHLQPLGLRHRGAARPCAFSGRG